MLFQTYKIKNKGEGNNFYGFFACKYYFKNFQQNTKNRRGFLIFFFDKFLKYVKMKFF